VVDAATGADSAPLDLALQLVRDGGTVIVQNAYHPDVRLTTPIRDIFRRSIRLVGTFSACRREQPSDFRLALSFLQDHSQQVNVLVTEAGALADLPSILAGHHRHGTRQVVAISWPPNR
jgi:threonine dehydrogenase-like Zn-dependent dehydrogenase